MSTLSTVRLGHPLLKLAEVAVEVPKPLGPHGRLNAIACRERDSKPFPLAETEEVHGKRVDVGVVVEYFETWLMGNRERRSRKPG